MAETETKPPAQENDNLTMVLYVGMDLEYYHRLRQRFHTLYPGEYKFKELLLNKKYSAEELFVLVFV